MTPRWTLPEDARLREMVSDGLDYVAIAREIGRSVPACRQRGSFLGLRIDPATVGASAAARGRAS